MTKTALVPTYPRPPAQIEVFVEILGVDLTVEFLLRFGGAELYVAKDPKSRSQLVAFVGPERAKALGQVTDRLQRRVPLVKPWTAQYLAWKGMWVAEIARTLHTTDVSVRGWLNPKPKPEKYQ